MRNYPLCRVCGKPTGGYQIHAHLKCIKGGKHHCCKRGKAIIQCDKLGNVITRWNSQGELERLTTFKRKHVGRVLNGQFKTHKGFVWRYENE